jgi:hypothetical protein
MVSTTPFANDQTRVAVICREITEYHASNEQKSISASAGKIGFLKSENVFGVLGFAFDRPELIRCLPPECRNTARRLRSRF